MGSVLKEEQETGNGNAEMWKYGNGEMPVFGVRGPYQLHCVSWLCTVPAQKSSLIKFANHGYGSSELIDLMMSFLNPVM